MKKENYQIPLIEVINVLSDVICTSGVEPTNPFDPFDEDDDGTDVF